jgi:uncharacterized protein (DUF983 family)
MSTSGVSPFTAGMKCRCPNCGEGQVFRGFLTFKDSCEACGADFTIADSGDGPAFFVMFLVLIIVVPAAMLTELFFRPHWIVHVILWVPATFALSMLFLRPFKSLLFALQWKNKAGEARFEDLPPPS